MADIKATSLGGVPKGTTANRPTSPAVGDVYYNGTLGCLEIYTSQGWVANSAPPGIPAIGTATYSATNKAYNNSSASVTFTPGEGGGLPSSYRITSSPGGFIGTGSSSPITVEGLQSATAYTFSVTGTNNFGTSASSTNSNSITANTTPQSPTIGTLSFVSTSELSLTFTPAASGGSSITNYKYSADGINYTLLSPPQTTSPLSLTGLNPNTLYSIYIKAVNTNGDSSASAASNSVSTGATFSGGTLTSDATYNYRTFTSTGSLVVGVTAGTVDILSIAGGGGANRYYGGGGGAGGYVYTSSRSISPGTYTVTIGSGGTGYANGTNTTITGGALSVTAAVGGGAGGDGGGTSNNGATQGGSGGGGGSSANVPSGAASNAAGQGNAGGNSPGSSGTYSGGGGGGAGAAGQTPSTTNSPGGNGGVGITNSNINAFGAATSTGQFVSPNYYYAGGGAGGTAVSTIGSGGYGGGGNGGNSLSGNLNTTSATNGTSNTGGGGGGGAGSDAVAKNGGSGILIVRWAK
jgi:hypothetical protein